MLHESGATRGKGPVRSAGRLGALLWASLGIACASPVKVELDERVDLSRYRAWDWLPGTATTVDAPQADARSLEARLLRSVERSLQGHGFERKRGRADFFVSCHLRVVRSVVSVSETPAVQQLSSHHDSPSYEIQATRTEEQLYETVHLAIVVAGARQRRVVWRGDFQERVRNEFSPHLEEAVQSVFEHFPHAAGPAASPPPAEPGHYSRIPRRAELRPGGPPA